MHHQPGWVEKALNLVPLSKEASALQPEIGRTEAGREATEFVQKELQHPENFVGTEEASEAKAGLSEGVKEAMARILGGRK